MRPQPKKSELSIRVCHECAADYCGDIEERLTLFKCACARLILPHEPEYLAALEDAEANVLRGYRAYERRSIVANRSINLQSVTEGLSAEIPGAAAVLALDKAIGEPGPASASAVINVCLTWARSNARRFAEDLDAAWREMEALMTLVLDRILAAETLEDSAAECRKPVRIASDCVVH
ncbi:MAG: hypothetical protein IPF82_16830 [Blastocatellia bacterium]|nr:hypothetical protein [Blastocatellia bacterium]